MAKEILTPEQFRDAMEKIAQNNDTEAAHSYADDLLCDLLEALGYEDGIVVYNNMDKWYA